MNTLQVLINKQYPYICTEKKQVTITGVVLLTRYPAECLIDTLLPIMLIDHDQKEKKVNIVLKIYCPRNSKMMMMMVMMIMMIIK